jgi:hypothetical protein
VITLTQQMPVSREIELDIDRKAQAVLTAMLEELPLAGISLMRSIASLLRSNRGHSELIGDVEHALYLVLGFVLAEGHKHADRSSNIDLNFFAIRTGRSIEIEARLTPVGGTGVVAWGMTIVRLRSDQYLVTNS